MSFEITSQPNYSEFIHLSRYSRWREEEQRRENWEETVDRLIDFWVKKYPLLNELIVGTSTTYANELWTSIYNLEDMPSMRTMMTAGPALDRDNIAGYNCSAATIQGRGKHLDIMTTEMEELGFDSPISIQLKNPITFDEIFYILLCGTGVGFSVERQFINLLPTVGKQLDRAILRRSNKNYLGVSKEELSYVDRKNNTIKVADSKYGWSSALRCIIVELYNGNFKINWDTSEVRPAGTPLKTFGGRASGPEPLDDLFRFCVSLFMGALGRKLTSIEVHSLVCKIASIVVVGGVRRSALISLSNLSDLRMANAKNGSWWIENLHFALANNSVVYTEKPDPETFLKEWTTLIESKSGERGVINRQALKKQVAKNGKRDSNYEFIVNPCSEVILRDQGLCNLTEVVVRPNDTFEDLKRKVKLATILGTLQSTLTDFVYLNPEWKKNAEEERLLGVSLTGIMDHPVLSGQLSWGEDTKWFGPYKGLPDKLLESTLQELKEVTIETNREWANKLGINPSAAVTCIKPSGTVSQLVDSSSGIHPRYSRYYIRTVRNDIKDPVTQLLKDQGVYWEVDITNPTNVIFYFPIKSPHNAIVRDEISAIDQLDLWKLYQDNWCEHKVSMTCYVKDHEWIEVASWVYKNFDDVSGISFLPWDSGNYKQAPYQEITEKEYYKWLEKTPKQIDWSRLSDYEKEDMTIAMQEYACSGNSCEI